METRFGDKEGRHTYLQIAHTDNEAAAMELKEELSREYPFFEVHADPLSLSVSCHIGPGSLAVACTKVLDF